MNRTKELITAAFWHLLEEHPYSKITVKDIVDYCRINRNTFYYHFHDIPEVLELSVLKDMEFIIQNYNKFESPIDCLAPIVQRSTERKKAILHIYNSLQRETFLNYLEKITRYTVTEYINAITASRSVPEKDKTTLIRYYKCLLVGISLDWLNDGMSFDPMEDMARITSLIGNEPLKIIQNFGDSQ